MRVLAAIQEARLRHRIWTDWQQGECALIAPIVSSHYAVPAVTPCFVGFIPTPLGSCAMPKSSAKPFPHTIVFLRLFVWKVMSQPGSGSCIITMCLNQLGPMGMMIRLHGKLKRTRLAVIGWRKNLIFLVSNQVNLVPHSVVRLLSTRQQAHGRHAGGGCHLAIGAFCQAA